VHFHKRLNGDLDKIISRSAHLLVRIGLLVLSSHVRFLVLLNLGEAKSARFYSDMDYSGGAWNAREQTRRNFFVSYLQIPCELRVDGTSLVGLRSP
jgi:hypothetical protein